MPIWSVAGVLVATAAALGMLVNLVVTVAGAARRSRSGTTTSGLVVAVDARSEAAGEGMQVVHYPTVQFHDGTGTRRFRNRLPVAHCPAPGGRLTVWYDPADPAARPVVETGSSAGAAVAYAVGLVLAVLVALFMYWFGSVWHGPPL